MNHDLSGTKKYLWVVIWKQRKTIFHFVWKFVWLNLLCSWTEMLAWMALSELAPMRMLGLSQIALGATKHFAVFHVCTMLLINIRGRPKQNKFKKRISISPRKTEQNYVLWWEFLEVSHLRSLIPKMSLHYTKAPLHYEFMPKKQRYNKTEFVVVISKNATLFHNMISNNVLIFYYVISTRRQCSISFSFSLCCEIVMCR